MAKQKSNPVPAPAPTPSDKPEATNGPMPAPVPRALKPETELKASAAPTPTAAPAPIAAPTPSTEPVPTEAVAIPVPVPVAVPVLEADLSDIRSAAPPANPNPSLGFDTTPHTMDDLSLLYQIYIKHRLQEQINFYNSRIRENERNSDFTFRAGALILTASSLIATISASVTSADNPTLSFILTVSAAVLPAFAALIASFRQLYGWDKQATIYRDSLLALERVSLLTPDDDRLPFTNLAPIYPELVNRAEDIFTSEVGQWGQFVLSKDKAAGAGEQDIVARSASNFNLTNEQITALQTVLNSGQKTDISVQTVKTTDVVMQTELPPTPAAPDAPAEKMVTTISSVTETNTSVVPAPVVPTPASVPAPAIPAPKNGINGEHTEDALKTPDDSGSVG